MSPTRLAVPDAADRDALAEFVGRAVRLDPGVPVRLRTVGAQVQAWATTPFDVLVTASVLGWTAPGDVTVTGSDLLAALTVVAGPDLDAGPAVDQRWRGALPDGGPGAGPGDRAWHRLDGVPLDALDAAAVRGIGAARDGAPDGRPSSSLLDEVVVRVRGDAEEVAVPMRCVLALAGLGLLGAGVARAGGGGAGDGAVTTEQADAWTDGDWLRLDVPGAAVVRRRRPQLAWA